ncbi:MAG: GW dipeptide domain-containing protein [Bacteroidota bacterium]
MTRNKAIFIIVLLILSSFFIVTTCYRNGGLSKQKALPAGMHGVVVDQVVQTSNYTYLQVEENNGKIWIAVVRCEAKPGDSLYYTMAFEMKNFVSKELSRTFPSVFFVQDPSSKMPVVKAPEKLTPKKAEAVRKADIHVGVPQGGISIGDLYKDPGSCSGKQVTIRGTVVKLNTQIMGKNWIHIQDGTDFGGKFDLTITTKDSIPVNKTATFKGTITLNKDFGYGYLYDVLMENASTSDIK